MEVNPSKQRGYGQSWLPRRVGKALDKFNKQVNRKKHQKQAQMVAMNKNRDLQKESDNDSQTSLSPKSIHSHDRKLGNRPVRVSVQNQHYNQESFRSRGEPIPLIYDNDKSVEQTQRERERERES